MENLFNSLLEELIIAAFGGVFVLIATKTISKFKKLKLEKKYPISGKYLSSYEDELDGKKVVIKAPVVLSQNGHRIKGITEFEGRTWILSGELSSYGYIHGIYHAESVHDRGIGNFFLEFMIDGDMRGLWSGYDSVNKIIQSGKYSFTKIPEILITKIKTNQIPNVISIAEKQLGEAYISIDDLKNEDNIAIVASVDGKIVGFCVGKVELITDIYKRIPQLAEKKLQQFEVIKSVGLIASMATDPDFTGRGIGDKLLGDCIEKLKNSGSKTLLMNGWKSENGIHIGSLAKKYGFKEILEIKNFWYEDSKIHRYKCPSCGEPPCKCGAVIFVNHSN